MARWVGLSVWVMSEYATIHSEEDGCPYEHENEALSPSEFLHAKSMNDRFPEASMDNSQTDHIE